MPECLIGIGSNLGNREEILNTAVRAFERRIKVTASSRWFTYPAVGGPAGQDDFLNGAVRGDTDLTPQELAAFLHEIEKEAGRERVVRWSARTLDCDLLLYGEQIVDTPELSVPHPRMITRRFVLEPANEIAAEMIEPVSGKTIEWLFRHLKSAAPYTAVVGRDQKFVSRIAREVSQHCGCRLLTHAPFARGGANEFLEWLTEANDLLAMDDDGAIVTDFWLWQPLLENPGWQLPPDFRPHHDPKLVIVTEPLSSEFGQRYSAIDHRYRAPTLFLPEDRERAIQDAIGSVMAMN